MVKLTYEECRLTFNIIYKIGKIKLNQKYYCKRFAKIHGISLKNHKEVIEHYKRFKKELKGMNNSE